MIAGVPDAWAFLMILAWMLLAGNWAMLTRHVWQWAVGALCRR